jgi:D-lactate dehydrogenase (cytochrome)
VPVIPFGVGSSLEGHLLAVQGGISIDVSRMNKVLSINADDLTVTVQPGVTRKQLNEEIKSTGLFFPIDPGADASIGGMSATRASGTNAVRYGTMRENVLALEVVTASGEVIRTGTRAKKSSAGYDLTRLMVGSEGTLGVITEVTLRIYPLPEAVSAAICSFPSIEAAVRTTIEVIQLGVPIARVELIDVNTVRMVNAYAKLNLREEPMLLMEFHGSPAGVKEQAETVQEIASGHGGNAFEWASTPEERTRCGPRGTTATSRGAVAPGLPRDLHRHLRADLAPGRLPARLGGRGRCQRHPLLPGRPRGRRQLPLRLPARSERSPKSA